MYKILIVEDEPPIVRYVNRLIKDSNKDFFVVGTAENGKEALEKIGILQPDLVITDIRMPVMDGLHLIKKINTHYPGIFTVIVSGYQDFEYAKEGLKEGAVDYLLKPLDPILLNNVLHKISIRLDDTYRIEGKKLISMLINNENVEAYMLERYLNYNYFSVIGIRCGSLPPKRINIKSDGATLPILSNLEIARLESKFGLSRIWTLEGRDENEVLIIIGSNNGDFNNVMDIVNYFTQEAGRLPRFYTIVYTPSFVKAYDLSTEIRTIINKIVTLTVIGKSQLIKSTDVSMSIDNAILDSSLEKKLSFLINNRIMDGLKNELVSIFEQWEKTSKTQVYVEKMLWQILCLIERSITYPNDFGQTAEANLSKALYYSNDFGGILRYLWNIIEDAISPKKPDKINPEESALMLYENIIQYIHNNLAEPITLQNLCDVFGVSQPYLSRLFRKYGGISFKDYLTNIRIEKALSLMGKPQNMLIKDIALMVGYEDPFYFSKVFKSLTGWTPSEYLKQIT